MKIRKTENSWESFPSWAHFFILQNREKNVKRKVLWKHFYTNTLSHLPLIHDLMTFAHKLSLSLFPLLILTFTTHQRPGSLLSLSLSLSLSSFFFSTWPNQVDTFYCFLSSLYSTLIYCFLLNSSLLTTFLWAECSFSICPAAFMSWPLVGYKIFCPIKFICTLL